MPVSYFTRGFASELTKVAARAGLKMIRRLVASGDTAKAERLALTPGVLKKTKAGSQVKHLGSGMEGTSTLIAHPKKGIAVRKVYDPKGIAGPELVKRKAEVGRKLNDSSDVAKFLGETKTRIGPAHFYEHVPGKTVGSMGGFAKGTERPTSGMSTAKSTPKSKASSAPSAPQSRITGVQEAAAAQVKRLKRRGEREGVQIKDLHEDNVIAGPKGNKAVDYIPHEKGKPSGYRREALEKAEAAQKAADRGERHEYVDYLEDPRRPGNLMARAFRGAPPLPPRRS